MQEKVVPLDLQWLFPRQVGDTDVSAPLNVTPMYFSYNEIKSYEWGWHDIYILFSAELLLHLYVYLGGR